LGRFFCGWFCPLGTLQQAVSYIFKKIFFRKKIETYQPAQRIKYLFVIVLLVLSLLRINLTGLFSPFTILYRGSYFIIKAIFYFFIFLNKTFNIFANDRIFYWFQTQIEFFSSGKYTYAFLNSGIIFTILLLNLFSTRFWCRFLCPLGGFLGFISRKSILHINRSDNCQNCLKCVKDCQGACNPHLKDGWIKQECLFCLNCLKCPEESLKLNIYSPGRLPRLEQGKIDLTRRQVLCAMAGGLVAYPLLKLNFKRSVTSTLIRPPGALAEKDFLNQCIRCQACIKNCPTQFLQPSLFEMGILGLFTPYGNGKVGYCKYDCNLCGAVCPTGAIRNLTLSEKQSFKIATAFIDKKRCLAYSKGIVCLACYNNCPLQDKAIVTVEIDRGLYGPKIIPDKCLGCGLCENICPAQAISTRNTKMPPYISTGG
ncbi:MAG: 4Fe-4S dicluster domain-containing protein, partial [Candidatus Omnitrophota bacterium]